MRSSAWTGWSSRIEVPDMPPRGAEGGFYGKLWNCIGGRNYGHLLFDGAHCEKSASKQQMDSQPGRAAGRDFGPGGMAVHAGLSRRDVLTALAVGIVSGLAATGVHEAGCQLTREKP